MFQTFFTEHRTLVFLLGVIIVVLPFLVYYVTTALKHHPKGLIAAALSNMGERFGYYIMNAVLALFIVSKFGLTDAQAGAIYSVFYCLIYILSLVGGIIADKSLKRTRFEFSYLIPDYEVMVAELADWMRAHKHLYPHYNL